MTDVQVFTADGTWSRPSDVKHVRVVAVGGGGGGGGGDVGGAGVNGGGGGKGGHYACAEFSAVDLQQTVGIQVGAGGAGGASTANGTNGEDSIFGVALSSEILGVTSSVQDSDSTSFVISLPNGATTQGDLLLVCVTKDGTGAITWPSGWSDPTLTEGAVGGGATAYMGARWRYIDGTEGFTGAGDTITVTGASEKWQADAWLITGANTGQDPSMDAITGTGTAANPTNTSTNQRRFDRFLFIVQATWNDDPGAVTVYPSGYTDNQHQAVTTAPGNTRHARCSKFSAFPYDDPGAFTVPNGDWRTLTICLPVSTQGELLRAGGGEAGAGAAGTGGDNAWASTVGWTTAIDGGNGGKGGGDYGGGYAAAIGGTGTVFSGAGGGGGGGRDGGGTGQAGANGGASPDYGVVGSSLVATIPITTGYSGDSTRGGDGGHGGAGATTTGANGANGGVVGGGGGGGGGAGTTGGTGGTGGDGRVWVYSW